MSESVRESVSRVAFAARHPRMAFRRLRGVAFIEITAQEISKHVSGIRVIVEAGALNGIDTVGLSETWPAATVHAFEPVPEAFLEIVNRTSDLPNVRRYQAALSSHSGMAKLHISSNADGGYRPDSSSLLPPSGHLESMPNVKFDTAIDVRTLTLDDWAATNGVNTVDLLWLDMQGMELAVLRASKTILPTVRAVMMEVSRRELYAGTPLYHEVKKWMSQAGFTPVVDRVSYQFGNILFTRRRAGALAPTTY